jgi:hypothetical protein
MKVLVCVLLVLGAAFVCNAAVYSTADFQTESHFFGRSGDITVFPVNVAQDDAELILVDNMFHYTTTMSRIQEKGVGELIAHLMGSVSLNGDVSKAEFPKVNLFDRPKANLLFAVDSVGTESMKSLNNLKLFSNERNIRIPITDKRCRDTICSLTSMMTASTPSTHGIIASKWVDSGATVSAYSSETAQPAAANLFDTVSQTWDGKSLFVSGSACKGVASSLASHVSKDTDSFVMHFDKQTSQFVNGRKSRDTTLDLTKVDILAILKGLAVPGIQLNFLVTNEVEVVLADGKTFTFDLNQKEYFVFFSEIALVQNVLETLQSNAHLAVLVGDNNPDFFSFGFIGVKSMQTKYGKLSTQSTIGLILLDSFLTAVTAELSTLYGGRLATEVILVGNSQKTPLDNKDAKDTAFRSVVSLMTKEKFETFYPELYMPSSHMEVTAVCFDLKRQLVHYGLDAYCPEKPQTFGNFKLAADSNTTSNSTSDAGNFQILLWSGIGLGLAFFSAVMLLCFIDTSKDTLIYRTSHHPHSS